jgi:heme/copper-type cytochrome/quinol oxidase subunit 2
MVILWIAILIFVISGASAFAITTEDFENNKACSIFLWVITILVVVLIILQIHTPTAIDVYQGKTTLEITYKDGVPVDSTVVFKDGK